MWASTERPRSPDARRPDIDGLRCVAILGVLIFHAWPHWLPGGFLGVDVFFVISGYLITGVLARAARKEAFSLVDFYARRVRRILPALIPVLIVAWAYGWLMLLPNEYRSLGKHVAAGATFGSNAVLWQESGYFDSQNKPLMHLWSLAVEWQFYLLWPFLFVATKGRSRHAQIALIALLALVSFCSFKVLAINWPQAAFYLSTSRCWELAIGAVLALAELARVEGERRWVAAATPSAWLRDFRQWAVLLGLSVIVFTYARADGRADATWATLSATLATALVISSQGRPIRGMRFLTHPVMVFIGLVSYSLYLWHWPLLSFVSIVEPGAGAITRASAVGIAVILAIVSFKYIEQPFLRHSSPRAGPFALVSVLLLCGMVGYATYRGAIEPRSAAYGAERFARAAAESWPASGRRLPNDDPKKVYFSEGAPTHRVLFLGDSTIQQYYPRIQKLHADKHLVTRGSIFITAYACAPIARPDGDPCAYARDAARYADDPSVDSVVIGAFWPIYFINAGELPQSANAWRATSLRPNTDADLEVLEKMVRDFIAHGKDVYIVLQAPYGPTIDPREVFRRSLHDLHFTLTIRAWDRQELEWTVRPIIGRLQEIAQRTGAHVIDPLDVLCDAKHCPAVTPAGEPMYLDEMHLRPSYVAESVKFLDRLLVLN